MDPLLEELDMEEEVDYDLDDDFLNQGKSPFLLAQKCLKFWSLARLKRQKAYSGAESDFAI